MNSLGGFTFGQLTPGDYAVEAFVLGGFVSDPALVAAKVQPSTPSRLSYHGGVAKVSAGAGETKTVSIAPAVHQTKLEIHVAKAQDPRFDPKKTGHPTVIVSRNLGLLLGMTGNCTDRRTSVWGGL
jgi:hypothetical protein